MTRITSAPVHLGVFLIILGGLMLTSFMKISPLDTIQSFSVVIALFGIWLAVVSFAMPAPAKSYAATRAMFLGWGGILTGLGSLWFAAYYGLLLIVLSVLLIMAGIGAVGYAFMRGQSRTSPPSVA